MKDINEKLNNVQQVLEDESLPQGLREEMTKYMRKLGLDSIPEGPFKRDLLAQLARAHQADSDVA